LFSVEQQDENIDEAFIDQQAFIEQQAQNEIPKDLEHLLADLPEQQFLEFQDFAP
jgi:hypothetical protein